LEEQGGPEIAEPGPIGERLFGPLRPGRASLRRKDKDLAGVNQIRIADTCRFAFSAPPFYAKYDIPLLITKMGEFYSNTCDAPVWGARPPRLVSLIAIEKNHLFKPIWSEHGPAPSSSFLKRLRRFVFRRLSANCRIQDAVGSRFIHFENACR